jgi:hypothetical protein
MSEGPIERAAERSGATGLSCNRMHRNENDGMMLSQRSAPSITCSCGAAIRCEKLTDPHSPIMGTKSRDRLSGSSVRMAAQKEVEARSAMRAVQRRRCAVSQSVNPLLQIRWLRDRPTRDRPSHANADLWSLRRTAADARSFGEGSARSRMRCRRQAAACPRNGTGDWKQHPEHNLCLPCVAAFRSLPCHIRCPPPRMRTLPLRQWRERSFDARSWASSQSLHRAVHELPSGEPVRPSVPFGR